MPTPLILSRLTFYTHAFFRLIRQLIQHGLKFHPSCFERRLIGLT